MKYKNLIGAEIRKRRNALGWSQSEFAIKLQLAGLDYDRSQVSKIECRVVHISDYELVFLADVLKVSIGELFQSRPSEEPLHSYVRRTLEKRTRSLRVVSEEGEGDQRAKSGY